MTKIFLLKDQHGRILCACETEEMMRRMLILCEEFPLYTEETELWDGSDEPATITVWEGIFFKTREGQITEPIIVDRRICNFDPLWSDVDEVTLKTRTDHFGHSTTVAYGTDRDAVTKKIYEAYNDVSS